MTNEQILLSAFTALEGAHFYSAFLPSVMTIRKFAGDNEAVKALREGEVLATAFALGLGGIVAKLIKNSTPLYFAAGTSLLMILVYELAIRGNNIQQTPMHNSISDNAYTGVWTHANN